MSNININQLNISQTKMCLLYAQSLEIQKLYYQTIRENTLNYLKYYLLPKKWLDELKYKYNYSYIQKQISTLDFSDYNIFKQNLLKNNSKNNDNNNNFMNEFQSIETYIEKKYSSLYHFNYPFNFVLVREDIFEDMNINKKLLYEIIIGEENIFIIDNKIDNKNKNIFICSISYDKFNEDISEFIVNVEGFLILNDKKKNKETKRLIKYISDNKGIKNYYKERNINITSYEEQTIFDKEGEEVGKFFKIQQKQEYLTPDEFLDEYINQGMNQNDNVHENIEGDGKITEILLDKNFRSKINQIKESEEKSKTSKCISIKGDIYYYISRDRNNSKYSVSEFNEMPQINYFNNNNYNL